MVIACAMDAMDASAPDADVLLVLRDGRSVPTSAAFLAHASPVLCDALKCAAASTKRRREATELPCLPVEGSWEGWQALLALLKHACVSGDALELDLVSAFHAAPVAHRYAMQGVLDRCIATVKRHRPLPLVPIEPRGDASLLPLSLDTRRQHRQPNQLPHQDQAVRQGSRGLAGTSKASGSAGEGQGQEPAQPPTLFEWLQLADDMQCIPLTDVLLEQLAAYTGDVEAAWPAAGAGVGGAAAAASAWPAAPAAAAGLGGLAGPAWLPAGAPAWAGGVTGFTGVAACAWVPAGGAQAAPAAAAMRRALTSPGARRHLQGLCSETVMRLLNVTVGLPAGFQEVRMADVRNPPSFNEELQGSYNPYASSCFAGPSESLLLLPLGKDIALVEPHDRQRSLLQGHTERVRAVCGDEGHAVSAAANAAALRVWNLATRQCCGAIETGTDVGAVCMWDGFVAGGGFYGDLQVWDLATGVEVADLSSDGMQYMSGHEARVWDVKHVGASRGMLVSASDDGKLKIWDVRAGRCGCVRTLRDGGSEVWSVAVCRQGRAAVSSSRDGAVRVWDLGSGRCVHTMHVPDPSGHYEGALSVCDVFWRVWMDGDATTVHGEPLPASLHVWDMCSGKLLFSQSWPGVEIEGMCCSRDLSQVAAVVAPARHVATGGGGGPHPPLATRRVWCWGKV